MCVRLLEKWQKKLVKIGKIRLRVLCVGRSAPFFNLPANAHSKYIDSLIKNIDSINDGIDRGLALKTFD